MTKIAEPRQQFIDLTNPLTQKLKELEEKLEGKVEPFTWKALPYKAPWKDNKEAEYQKGEYTKDVQGYVHLRGLIENTEAYTYEPASKTLICTLPEGFRPKKRVVQTCYQADTAGHLAIIRIDIKSNGEVLLIKDWESSGNNGLAAYLSLDGVLFSIN